MLTKAGCSCTPKFYASKHETQGRHGWVPGGYLDYIVMEKLEGVPLSMSFVAKMSIEERERLKAAFKKSYM